MDVRLRLQAIRQAMDGEAIDALYLRPGANLTYLTGIRRQQPHHTDTNAYADWIEGVYLGAHRAVLVAPRMGSEFFLQQARGKPWITDVRVVLEGEDPTAVMRDVLQQVAPGARRVAVDDRAWAPVVQALHAAGLEVSAARRLIDPMRMVKSAEELDAMRKAAQLADDVYAQALAVLREGASELDVAHEIDYRFALGGADYPSFVTGVRFTRPNSDRPHALRHGARTLAPGDAVTFDFGCVHEEYCSDFGRTAFVGEPPREFTTMFDAVLASQHAAMAAMRAGAVTAEDVHQTARRVLQEAGYADYFTHRTGHGIGMTVHEPPYLDSGDRTVLLEHMTFTVEPSSRVPNGYACRIEDVVVVTPQGAEPLTTAPRTLAVIE
ncbi:MAG: Xaa-Pro peptidase family protein [Armatimonadota bacterium]|nr:Xaa-Pro peptidase family protein [Armatimonadota bacterium]MDR5696607.1 Xaa-Pro peptidase family protein [Armatimonadota bacterium]